MHDFLNALFDFSFKEFVTTKIIKVIYAIGILIAAIGAIVFMVSGFKSSALLGIIFLILSPIIFIIYAIIIRVWLEVVIVMFRIAEDVSKIAGTKHE